MAISDIEELGGKAASILQNLIQKQAESVLAINQEGKEWKVLVEALEKKVVPDTYDLMGRYELRFNETGKLLGYKQVMLRRRSDRLEEDKK